jgi:hypothetical protein
LTPTVQLAPGEPVARFSLPTLIPLSSGILHHALFALVAFPVQGFFLSLRLPQ